MHLSSDNVTSFGFVNSHLDFNEHCAFSCSCRRTLFSLCFLLILMELENEWSWGGMMQKGVNFVVS